MVHSIHGMGAAEAMVLAAHGPMQIYIPVQCTSQHVAPCSVIYDGCCVPMNTYLALHGVQREQAGHSSCG